MHGRTGLVPTQQPHINRLIWSSPLFIQPQLGRPAGHVTCFPYVWRKMFSSNCRKETCWGKKGPFFWKPTKWSINSYDSRDYEYLKAFQDLSVTALQTAAPKQKNLGKISISWHRSPNDFLECRYQAFRKYSDLNPEASENHCSVNMFFIGQSALDMMRYLQKVDGTSSDTTEKLLEVAYRVCGWTQERHHWPPKDPQRSTYKCIEYGEQKH